MTLEEAISDSEKLLKKIEGGDDTVSEYHQQLVDWFKELQAYRIKHEQKLLAEMVSKDKKRNPIDWEVHDDDGDWSMFPKVCGYYPDKCPYNIEGFEVTSETCNRCFGKDHYNE